MLQRLSGSFEVEKENIGKDARLKKNGIVLDTESYRVSGVGHFCILRLNAPPCDSKAKKKRVDQFAETLFLQGGPAVDTITRLFGRETAGRLLLHHMYGSDFCSKLLI